MTKVRTPLFPLYSTVRHLLPVCCGVPKSTVLGMINAIHDQMGTPQNPVDWSEPDAWIPVRLSGTSSTLARRIWDESKQAVNPRHIYGAYLFMNTYHLVEPDGANVYQLTPRGQGFLAGEPALIRELDDAEGLLHLLAILATKTRVKRGDLLDEWGQFLQEYSTFGSPSTIKDTLRRRLQALVERGLVLRDGNVYAISPAGLSYMGSTTPTASDPRRKVLAALQSFNEAQREALRERLGAMNPYRFEQLVRDLLDAMGYEDVTVTSQSGDKGVDVTATVQFGITTIQEVVQVKRHKGTIHRPVLDQLRGSLPYHKALRGTLITLGSFSKGCADGAFFPGAAPITLIDGDKLLDLLIEHEIGIRKRPAILNEIDDAYFDETGDATQVTAVTTDLEASP
jgi:restriction system protein